MASGIDPDSGAYRDLMVQLNVTLNGKPEIANYYRNGENQKKRYCLG